SGDPCRLIIRVRYMGYEMFDRFLVRRFPGAGDRKDKAPTACSINFVPVLDHAHVGLRAIGGIATHDDQLRPPRRHKCAHHLAKQGVFAAIPTVALGENESKAYRHAVPVPRRHQQDEAQAKKPGLMLAGPALWPRGPGPTSSRADGRSN